MAEKHLAQVVLPEEIGSQKLPFGVLESPGWGRWRSQQRYGTSVYGWIMADWWLTMGVLYIYIYIYIYTYIYIHIIEGSLEVKLPTIWTDGKAEVGRVREEKRRRAQSREESRAEKRAEQTGEQRSEESREESRAQKRKSQKKEDACARKRRLVAKDTVFSNVLCFRRVQN